MLGCEPKGQKAEKSARKMANGCRFHGLTSSQKSRLNNPARICRRNRAIEWRKARMGSEKTQTSGEDVMRKSQQEVA